jgi:hypothetical protein
MLVALAACWLSTRSLGWMYAYEIYSCPLTWYPISRVELVERFWKGLRWSAVRERDASNHPRYTGLHCSDIYGVRVPLAKLSLSQFQGGTA